MTHPWDSVGSHLVHFTRLDPAIAMIQLTRLNRSSVTVNSDLIKLIEQSPDTVITLVNGEKLLVRETIDEIVDRIIKFRRSIVHRPASSATPEHAANPEMLDMPSGDPSGKAGS